MTDRAPPEPDPEGWDRFTHAVDVALHTKPIHKAKATPKPKDESARKSRKT